MGRRDIMVMSKAIKSMKNNKRKGLSGDKRLKRLFRCIEEAYHDVPYYKQHFDKHGFDPRDIRSFSDLTAVPETRREDLIHYDLAARTSRKQAGKSLRTFNTTGSTGIPLKILRSRNEEFFYHYRRFRIMAQYGLRIRDKMIKVGPRMHKRLPFSWVLLQKAGIFRQKQLKPDENSESMLDAFLRESPDILTGYSSAVCRIARLVNKRGVSFPQMKFVVTGSETLTPVMRRTISSEFALPVYDNYESMESGPLAWECPETGLYHICEDNVILEVVSGNLPAEDGETGDVLVTTLRNRTMPFIRYRLNDRVTKGPDSCPCGFPVSTLRRIDGRKPDFLSLPHGREIYASTLDITIQDHSSWMTQYQVVQEKEDRVVLRIIPSRKPEPGECKALIRCMERFLGSEVQFDLQLMDDLPPGPGGKFRILRSLLRSEYSE